MAHTPCLCASDECLCESLCSGVKRSLVRETRGCQLYPFHFYGDNANVTSQQVQLVRLLSNRMSLMKGVQEHGKIKWSVDGSMTAGCKVLEMSVGVYLVIAYFEDKFSKSRTFSYRLGT